MNNTIKSMVVGGALIASTAASHASLGTEIYTGYHSMYEFRGVEFGDDGLFDVGVDLSYDLGNGFGIAAGVWFADSYGSNGGDFEEVDYTLAVTKTIGKVDLSAGFIYYDFPGTSSYSEEYFITAATEFENGIGLSIAYYNDPNSGRGADVTEGDYLEIETTKSWELSPCVALDLAVGAAWSFGYNADTDGGSLHGFNHYYVSVATPWSITENVSLTPYVKFVGAAGDFANEYGSGDSEDLFVGGISLSYSF